MATIEQLVTRVELRLALAAGFDVQVHAEDRIIELIRHKYNVLFDDHWWLDYMTLETMTLDGTTGKVTTDLTEKIRRFSDIHSAYYDTDDYPMPRLSTVVNPTKFRVRAIFPLPNEPTRVFQVRPINTTGDVHVWYRTKLADSVWEDGTYDTEVNMDEEVLILGSVYDFLSDDGTNERAELKFKNMFDSRLKQLRQLDMEQGLSKRSQALQSPPDRWE